MLIHLIVEYPGNVVKFQAMKYKTISKLVTESNLFPIREPKSILIINIMFTLYFLSSLFYKL